jgi:hypothetical protein
VERTSVEAIDEAVEADDEEPAALSEDLVTLGKAAVTEE